MSPPPPLLISLSFPAHFEPISGPTYEPHGAFAYFALRSRDTRLDT